MKKLVILYFILCVQVAFASLSHKPEILLTLDSSKDTFFLPGAVLIGIDVERAKCFGLKYYDYQSKNLESINLIGLYEGVCDVNQSGIYYLSKAGDNFLIAFYSFKDKKTETITAVGQQCNYIKVYGNNLFCLQGDRQKSSVNVINLKTKSAKQTCDMPGERRISSSESGENFLWLYSISTDKKHIAVGCRPSDGALFSSDSVERVIPVDKDKILIFESIKSDTTVSVLNLNDPTLTPNIILDKGSTVVGSHVPHYLIYKEEGKPRHVVKILPLNSGENVSDLTLPYLGEGFKPTQFLRTINARPKGVPNVSFYLENNETSLFPYISKEVSTNIRRLITLNPKTGDYSVITDNDSSWWPQPANNYNFEALNTFYENNNYHLIMSGRKNLRIVIPITGELINIELGDKEFLDEIRYDSLNHRLLYWVDKNDDLNSYLYAIKFR